MADHGLRDEAAGVAALRKFMGGDTLNIPEHVIDQSNGVPWHFWASLGIAWHAGYEAGVAACGNSRMEADK